MSVITCMLWLLSRRVNKIRNDIFLGGDSFDALSNPLAYAFRSCHELMKKGSLQRQNIYVNMMSKQIKSFFFLVL